jgi:hypothetical protein
MFSVRSVERCYKHDKLLVNESVREPLLFSCGKLVQNSEEGVCAPLEAVTKQRLIKT